MKQYTCIGLMSGTSLDGVDLAHVTFWQEQSEWKFAINQSECIPYTNQWLDRLVYLPEQTAETFAKANIYYGHYLGQIIQQFIQNYQLEADFISSHGQTIFHNPKKGYTVQIGHGAAIAKETNLPVICDLRTTDMAYGGQGAPIVPMGEQKLFPNFKQFVNIGGITNVSKHSNKEIIGYDVCMGNVVMNLLSNELNFPYDAGGAIAKSGIVNNKLLKRLNQNPFLAKKPPKTLHANDVIRETTLLFDEISDTIPNYLRTLVEHLAYQLSKNLDGDYPTLVTGGGAFNSFLIERVQELTKSKIVVPEKEIVEMKEALIIAFLGLLRILKLENALASVTGASKNTVNGAVYLP